MFSIKAKLLFLLLPITLLMLAGLAGVHYLKTTEIVTREARDTLQAAVQARQVALVEYFESAELIGSAIAATDTVQTYAELTNRNLGGGNLQTLQRLQLRVANLLRSFQENHWGRFHHIFLFDRSNRIVASPGHGLAKIESPSELLKKDLSRNPWAMESLHKGKTVISDYWSWKRGDHSHPVLFFPVRDASNRIQAVIGIELNISYQQQIVSQGFDPGRTGRIFLATEKGVPIMQQEIAHTAPLTGEALNQTKLTGSWSGRRLNAQGREVIGHYVKHDQYPWILGAEIETSEVLVDLFQLHLILLAGLVGVLLVLAILLAMFAKRLVRSINTMVSQVERISRGEFDIEIPDTERRDEIGKLVVALQQLAFSLQLVAKKLRQFKALKKAS